MKTAPETTVIAALEHAAVEFGDRPGLADRTADGWVATSWCDDIPFNAYSFFYHHQVESTRLAVLQGGAGSSSNLPR